MESDFIAVEGEFNTADALWGFLQFPGIDFSESVFLNVEHQVYSEGAQRRLPPVFDASYLRQMGQKKPAIEYLVLQLYPQGLPIGEAARQMESIVTYQNYRDSDCQMILLLYDGLCAEVYCKNPAWLQSMLENAARIPDAEMTPKSSLTDSRTTMYL